MTNRHDTNSRFGLSALLAGWLVLGVACGTEPTTPDDNPGKDRGSVDYRALGNPSDGDAKNVETTNPARPEKTMKDAPMSEPDQDVIDRDALPTTEEAWKAHLAKTMSDPDDASIDLAYRVTRSAGTERPFTGLYWDEKSDGVYRCRCCNQKLFEASTKFESGTGWPSFWAPAGKGAVKEKRDESHGMVRAEVLCGNCDAHLGHVFDDGPRPTGQRYCMNSISLRLDPAK